MDKESYLKLVTCTMHRYLLRAGLAALACGLLFVAACSSGEEFGEFGAPRGQTAESGGEPASGGPVWTPTGNEGSITGTIHFQGTAPQFRPLSMDADAACAAKHSGPVYPEAVITNDNGTLRNAFVYVKSGLEGKSFAVPGTPVVLDQDGCLYHPHVLGIQAQQTLEVRNSDNTTHNIHPLPQVNREWNLGQPAGAQPIEQSFSRPEASIPVKCNQHPWMRAYIHVLSHPFYAVSGDDGTFTIEGLPPGSYEIEVMHEQYGAMTQQVTVAANGSVNTDFTYNSAQAYQRSSLTLMPTLVLH